MRLLLNLVVAALFVPQTAPTYPPPYPRAGTRALIDNERVQVWDVSWPKGVSTPPLHRDLHDMRGIYYWPGDRIFTSPDGAMRPCTVPAGWARIAR